MLWLHKAVHQHGSMGSQFPYLSYLPFMLPNSTFSVIAGENGPFTPLVPLFLG